MSIRVTYRRDFRIHGISLPKAALPYASGGGSKESKALPDDPVFFLFTHDAALVSPRHTGPLAVPVDANPIEHIELIHPQAISFPSPGCWLICQATDTFDLPADLEAKFLADPNGKGHEVHDHLKDALENSIIPRVDIASGVLIVGANDALVEVWETALDFAIPSNGGFRVPVDLATHSVVPSEAKEADIRGVILHATAATGHVAKTGHILWVAFNAYVGGRQETPASIPMFMGLFTCLEALTGLADASPLPKEVKLMDEVEAWVASERPAEDRALLKLLRGRLVRAPLQDRFERLGQLLQLEDLAADAEKFRVANELRNKLMHGSLTRVPKLWKGHDPTAMILGLSRKYLLGTVMWSTSNFPGVHFGE